MSTDGESVRICCIRFAEIEIGFIEAEFHLNKKERAPSRQNYHVYQCGIDAASPQMDSMEYLPHKANQRPCMHELLHCYGLSASSYSLVIFYSPLNQCQNAIFTFIPHAASAVRMES